MARTSRVLVSLFLISIILLPVVYVVGILLPMVLYAASESFFSEYSDFFTILGISLLLSMIVPPWDKKKLYFFSNAVKRFWKSFVKSKPLDEEFGFRDDIIHFAAKEITSNDCPLENKIIEENLESNEVSVLKFIVKVSRRSNIDEVGKRATSSTTQTRGNCSIFVLDRLKKPKQLYFFDKLVLFLKASCEILLFDLFNKWRGIRNKSQF